MQRIADNSIESVVPVQRVHRNRVVLVGEQTLLFTVKVHGAGLAVGATTQFFTHFLINKYLLLSFSGEI